MNWINPKDKLPEIDELCLVYYKGWGMYVSWLEDKNEFARKMAKENKDTYPVKLMWANIPSSGESIDPDEIECWMPCPLPPQYDEGEELFSQATTELFSLATT